MVGKNFSGKQMSEAFINSAFLALSGGFQDAYTYNTRNEVFAASYSICSWSFRGRSDSDAV